MKGAIVKILVVLAFLFTATPGIAVQTIVAFRGESGEFTLQSQRGLAMMRQVVTTDGSIDLWITFDMPFEGNPELRTDEVIATESQIKQWLVSQTVAVIASRGHARILDTPTGLEQAPGCRIRVTFRGFEELLTFSEVKHITYVHME